MLYMLIYAFSKQKKPLQDGFHFYRRILLFLFIILLFSMHFYCISIVFSF